MAAEIKKEIELEIAQSSLSTSWRIPRWRLMINALPSKS
jgi:hypothetical protein